MFLQAVTIINYNLLFAKIKLILTWLDNSIISVQTGAGFPTGKYCKVCQRKVDSCRCYSGPRCTNCRAKWPLAEICSSCLKQPKCNECSRHMAMCCFDQLQANANICFNCSNKKKKRSQNVRQTSGRVITEIDIDPRNAGSFEEMFNRTGDLIQHHIQSYHRELR